MFDVEFSRFTLLLAPLLLRAQAPPQVPPGSLIQLQVAQPAVDVTSPVTATAAFDPPVVRAGEKTFYRVTVDATESSIQWPEEIAAPPELKFGPDARGQITQILGNKFRPLTSFVYEVRAAGAGTFYRHEFHRECLRRAGGNSGGEPGCGRGQSRPPQPARQLVLEISATNVFLGEPFHVRVMLPAGPGNDIEALREIQLNGDGLMTDKTAMRQAIETVNVNGQLKPAFICEMMVTPIAAGRLKFSAQGFTAGREFTAPISIRGQVTFPAARRNMSCWFRIRWKSTCGRCRPKANAGIHRRDWKIFSRSAAIVHEPAARGRTGATRSCLSTAKAI